MTHDMVILSYQQARVVKEIEFQQSYVVFVLWCGIDPKRRVIKKGNLFFLFIFLSYFYGDVSEATNEEKIILEPDRASR